MKTVLLIRHSVPDKESKLENDLIPLSTEGESLARNLFDRLNVSSDNRVFSSPYLRAKQTAKVLSAKIIEDERLIERKIGNKETFTKDLWVKQYEDLDAANKNGESFRIVRERMTEFMDEVIESIDEGEMVVVVSHAAAICAYLQQYCKITVTDPENKYRRIVFKNKIVLDGHINCPSCFILDFDNEIKSVRYID